MKAVFETADSRPNSLSTRRSALWIVIPALSGTGFWWWQRNIGGPAPMPQGASKIPVTIVEFGDSGSRIGPKQVLKVVRPESDWYSRLTPQQFYVTRVGSTDMAFTGSYFNLHETGLYRCVCCGNALFSSDAKYDSGSGWPSFWAPIAEENVRSAQKPGLSREAALNAGIEVLCRLCDAHLGHIFGDGPEPSGLRYCINESSLRFVARKAAETSRLSTNGALPPEDQ